MAARVTGRLVGSTIELDADVPDLDGRRVRVTVEALDEAEDLDPVGAAFRDAPLDAEQTPERTADDIAACKRARENGKFASSEEVREKLAPHDPSR